MRRLLSALAFFVCLTGLSACGFQLRGAYEMPFEHLYLDMSQDSELAADLTRALKGNGTATIVDQRSKADAIFTIAGHQQQRNILSVNAQGRVRELQLIEIFAFRVIDRKGQNLVEPQPVVLKRDMTFSDSAALAKEQEETIIRQDMRRDLVQQVMRRLSKARPASPR